VQFFAPSFARFPNPFVISVNKAAVLTTVSTFIILVTTPKKTTTMKKKKKKKKSFVASGFSSSREPHFLTSYAA
jgi:hypothetical protein